MWETVVMGIWGCTLLIAMMGLIPMVVDIWRDVFGGKDKTLRKVVKPPFAPATSIALDTLTRIEARIDRLDSIVKPLSEIRPGAVTDNALHISALTLRVAELEASSVSNTMSIQRACNKLSDMDADLTALARAVGVYVDNKEDNK